MSKVARINIASMLWIAIIYILVGPAAAAGAPAHAPSKKGNHHVPTSGSKQRHRAASQEKDNSVKTNQVELPKHLGKIIVHGPKMAPICILETLKLALHRGYYLDRAHANDLLCRFYKVRGTRIKSRVHLWCRPTAGFRGSYNAAAADLELPELNLARVRKVLYQVPDKISRKCFKPE